jgi:hypothetical protein
MPFIVIVLVLDSLFSRSGAESIQSASGTGTTENAAAKYRGRARFTRSAHHLFRDRRTRSKSRALKEHLRPPCQAPCTKTKGLVEGTGSKPHLGSSKVKRLSQADRSKRTRVSEKLENVLIASGCFSL